MIMVCNQIKNIATICNNQKNILQITRNCKKIYRGETQIHQIGVNQAKKRE
jgi:hypothetical protein